VSNAPGSPATAAGWMIALVVLVAGCFLVAAVASSRRRAAQSAGRAAALARDVTASWPVRIKSAGFFTVHGPGLDSGWVSVRGEFIAVTAAPVARVLGGRECYFPAREAFVLHQPGYFGRDWLVITGTSSGKPAFVSVSAGNRAATENRWRALTAAGARPERPWLLRCL